ncbi:DUF5053 domain-containing protein [Capnocytophaga sp. ARDL2]|uniref:DUF5053 domain-containing protein n=1 Tax=Capnocytophaga sp. ARDL2 TaxID=3238809 RepID=UPI0035579DCD
MEIVQKQDNLTMMQVLDEIVLDVSWGRLSKDYFGKSASWIYNKLHGRDGNGGHGEFSEKEKEILRGALVDISEKIRHNANKI